MIVPASEVQQAVNEVEGSFVIDRLAMFPALSQRGVGADEDFTVMEGDDVGGRGIVEEIAMHAGDVGVIHDGDLDLWQRDKRCVG
jgi:hypothetical protein